MIHVLGSKYILNQAIFLGLVKVYDRHVIMLPRIDRWTEDFSSGPIELADFSASRRPRDTQKVDAVTAGARAEGNSSKKQIVQTLGYDCETIK